MAPLKAVFVAGSTISCLVECLIHELEELLANEIAVCVLRLYS